MPAPIYNPVTFRCVTKTNAAHAIAVTPFAEQLLAEKAADASLTVAEVTIGDYKGCTLADLAEILTSLRANADGYLNVQVTAHQPWEAFA